MTGRCRAACNGVIRGAGEVCCSTPDSRGSSRDGAPTVLGPGFGTATLDYNDKNTLSLADDTYNFSMSVFGLSAPATALHVHGAASTNENAGVRVSLNAAPLVYLVSGSHLLVGGKNVMAPTRLFVTLTSATNAGYGPTSFLDMLRGGLALMARRRRANQA